MADGWGPPIEQASGWGPPIGGDTPPPSSPPPSPPAETKTGWSDPVDTAGPMPGVMEALGIGAKESLSDVGKTITAFSSVAPEPEKETTPAAQPFELRDIEEPWGRGAPKVAYRLARSSPTLAAGIAGAGAGSFAAGPPGTLIGGIAGSALGAAVQTIGPVFANELKKSPDDPNGAWDRALHEAEISGIFSGAAWAAFPVRAFQGPVKQLAFQALGVQPGLAVAEQATKNIAAGRPADEGLGQAYIEGAVGTAVPALGHAAVAETFGRRAPQDFRTPAQEAARQVFDTKMQRADQLEEQAKLATGMPKLAEQLQQDANNTRAEAKHELFLANLPPTIKGERGKIAKTWVDNFQPELVSDKALQVDPLFARFKSATAQLRDAIIDRAEENYYKWNKVPFDDTRKFLEAYEENKPLPPDLLNKYPWMQERAQSYRQWLADAFANEKKYGSAAEFLENYFPHIWKNPIAARQLFTESNLPQVLGPKWFQKGRYYDLIEHGLANGLELKSNNPEELVTMRLMSGADMREKSRLLDSLYENGVAVPSEQAPPQILNPGRGNPNYWKEVIGPNGKKWMIAPDAQPLWENAVVAKGLWANEGVPGTLFQKWMGLKNAWVPVKLGLSLFHPVHVAHISLSNNVARALNTTFGKGQQTVGQRLMALPNALAQTVGDLAMAFPIGTPHAGKEIRKAWMTPEEKQTSQQKAMVQMMNEAGSSAQLSEQLRIKAKRDLSDAINNNKYLAPLYGVKRLLEKVQKPIFEEWIPNIKSAAVAREAQALFQRRPDLMNDPQQRMIAMRAIGKQVDNRFGEMFYGGLFWNRTIKDAAIGSFLSLGWNLGFAREFVGGALEPAARALAGAPTPTRQLIRDVTTKSTNAFVYTMTAMTINAIINKSMTGESPEGMDYIFPRIGGLNPDGSPRRISNPFYTREIPMAAKNIEERQSVLGGLTQMLYHKMMFAPIVEAMTNRNYFGYQIYDENAPGWKQAYQFGKHVLTDQYSPMSISGAQRSLQLSGKPSTGIEVLKQATDPDVWMPIMGFGPAPSYASKDPIDNRISYLFNRFVAPGEKPFSESENAKLRAEARTAYLGAKQRGDQAAAQEAARKMAQLGMKSQQIRKVQPGGNIQYMFSRLPASQQVALLTSMQADKFKEFFPKANKQAKADASVKVLWQKYYQ